MIHIGLFEGIGGFSLAAHWAGWQTYATCEINPIPQRVLKYYWPEAYHHGDIKTLNYETINSELSTRFGTEWRNQPVIITGGFPCQPYSLAGKRKGKEDERHLWPEMLRIIQEVSPEWVVGENVFGLINWSGGLVFDEVQADLEAAGYEVQPYVLPACAVNAPHRRDRIWFVAYRNAKQRERKERGFQPKSFNGSSEIITYTGLQRQAKRQEQSMGAIKLCEERDVTDTCNEGLQGGEKYGETGNVWQSRNEQLAGLLPSDWQNFQTQSPVCSRNDGIPAGLDGITVSKHRNESIKAYGNAIVPQVALQIFNAINQYENELEIIT